MKQQLHYAWYRMHTSDVSDKTKCIGRESHYSVSFIMRSTVSIIIFVIQLKTELLLCLIFAVEQWPSLCGLLLEQSQYDSC